MCLIWPLVLLMLGVELLPVSNMDQLYEYIKSYHFLRLNNSIMQLNVYIFRYTYRIIQQLK